MKSRASAQKHRSTKRLPATVSEYLKLPYKIELVPLKENGGGYLAMIPLLKGCQSDGTTPDEAVRNLREAQKAWLASSLKHGDPIPVPHA